ncbi:ATP-binding protein [Desulfospira joergensenii]|uniref:ATP-binding protein n=1 Tax=Desulfospira joergensenii TaxID=53329 RepID=UPI0003B5205B|nr:ATP-binding protein [Desulfospira joergensenii]
MGLRSRIIAVVVFACTVINLFLCFYFTEQISKLELKSLRTKIDKAAYMMKLVNARPLYNVDKETLKFNMETFFDDENMKSIAVAESDIGIDIRLERELGPGGMDIEKSFYIYYKGLKLGKMLVVYSTSLIEKKMTQFRMQMLLFTFTVTVVLVFILVFLINRLMQPVIRLTDAASEIAAGNLEKEIDQDGVGEVGELARNFAAMQGAIKEKITDLALTNKDLEEEIRQKEINEKKILRQSKVISSVNTFFQKSMLAETYTQIARLFIPIALEVVPSRYCFVGETRKDDPKRMVILATSENVLKERAIADMETWEIQVTGALGRVIKENIPVIANDPSSHPDFIKLPRNHVPLESFMGVPIRLGSEIKGILAFAGKENGYDSEDREAGLMLALALGEALNLRQQEDEKARLEKMMVQSEKMVSLGGLAAGMAHEINNPLAGILQNAQVIENRLKTPLPANIKAAEETGIDLDRLAVYLEKRNVYTMLESIMAAGKRAAGIVSNMLSFSRKSGSGFMPEDICELLDKTLELASSDYNLKTKFDFKKINVTKEYDPGVPRPKIKASEIQQVFFNILSNGAQAMMTGAGVENPLFFLAVFPDRDRTRDLVCIKIRDNGPGMEKEIRQRIFDPFFTTKEVGEGTGLGLAVSYFIITESHNGSIEVESGPGKGTCFTIKLPVDSPG